MERELLANHWALVAAAAVLAPVAFIVLSQVFGRSASGQLRNTRGDLAEEKLKLSRAATATRKAERRVDQLLTQGDLVKPRLLREGKEALQDARELEKIAADRVLVAENHVRRVIHEEFPPAKQDRLRRRCLPEPAPRRAPFSF